MDDRHWSDGSDVEYFSLDEEDAPEAA